MTSDRNIHGILDEIITDKIKNYDDDFIDEQLISNYNKLNDKCNQVILKIKNRKDKNKRK